MNVTKLDCPGFQSCVSCITHGCEWLLHYQEADVCLASHLSSPYLIDYVVSPGDICPPEEVKDETAVEGWPTWVLIMVGFLLLLLGIGSQWLFGLAIKWYRGRQGRVLVDQIPDLEIQRPAYNGALEMEFLGQPGDELEEVQYEAPPVRQVRPVQARRSLRLREAERLRRDIPLSPRRLRSGRKRD